MRPRLDLAGNTAFDIAFELSLIELECIGLDPQLSQERVDDEWQTKVDSVAAGNVVRIQSVTAARRIQIDDLLDVVVLKHLLQFAFVCSREQRENTAIGQQSIAFRSVNLSTHPSKGIRHAQQV